MQTFTSTGGVTVFEIFSTTYSGRNVNWSRAVEQVKQGNGEIVPLVIEAVRKGDKHKSLTYGFFYRMGAEYWDLYFDRAPKPKTLASVDKVMNELRSVYGDKVYAFLIPVLQESSLIEAGALDPSVHRLIWLDNNGLQGVD